MKGIAEIDSLNKKNSMNYFPNEIMRPIEKPTVTVPRQKFNVRNPIEVRDALQALACSESSKVATTLNAGRNREFNSDAAVNIVTELSDLMGKHTSPELFVRVDDEEMWPDKVPDLRKMTFGQRIEALQNIPRGKIMDAVPDLIGIEDSIPPDSNARVTPLLQPQCTSFVEQYWSVVPPDPSLSLGDETTHIITPVSCTSLQKRMELAVHDAIAAGGYTQQLERIGLLRHADINESDEWKSLMAAKVLRMLLGKSTYLNMCTGQGRIGQMYKGIQDWKLRRTDKISTEE
jgi:hypothetical protein